MKLSTCINYAIVAITFVSCHDKVSEQEQRFTLLDSAQTGIFFKNQLKSSSEFNIYTYRNFYNGGGVGIGDVNNDGLMDIYLTANMEANRLYINKGNFQFEDVTERAGVGGTKSWATGVAMVDINGDNLQDIYVCNSGDVKGGNKQNEFFINNGDGTFTDKAPDMGLADEGFSTHIAFFDYDRDGDLDAYLLNNSFTAIGSANLMKNQRHIRDDLGGDKLYRNDDGSFTDVSDEAGIYGSKVGFGLGISVTDLDKDGWMDLYISNDFFERDYIYMNNADGTFREEFESQVRSSSTSSMGSDAADLNGDAYPDIFVTEMLPESDERLKTLVHFESWDKYEYNVQNDYYHQYMRNTLQMNNGKPSGDAGISFTEVGRMLEVEATDWSWGALIMDMDNDGFKDIFVSNGIYLDIIDQDYLRYISNEAFIKTTIKNGEVDYQKLIEIIPSTPLSNYAFAGSAEHDFTNQAEAWGLDTPGFSNGSAYGDLDNDGDLDLVVNNVNMPAFLYQNNTDTSQNYLKVVLSGEAKNTNATGSKVTLKAADKIFYLEQSVTRGFQSSVDPRMNFGLGAIGNVDTLIVDWYNGNQTVLTDVVANQTIALTITESEQADQGNNQEIHAVFERSKWAPGYKHNENHYVDFQAERMLYHMNSTEGPKIVVGDVNSDGMDDFYVCGARLQPGSLFIQTENGFMTSNENPFEEDRFAEDSDALLFDVDSDGDLDLYVASGGNDNNSARYLEDRLYINNGRGEFLKSAGKLPSLQAHTAVVTEADYDQDGDRDLFIGVRMQPGKYGIPASSYLLVNDGSGKFTHANIPDEPLRSIGMVTGAIWTDLDQDGDEDLVVVGEWMSPYLLINDHGNFHHLTDQLENLSGWWMTVEASDMNGDSYPDLILGNHGLNTRFEASELKPIRCYINDFDGNGAVEQIITQYIGDQSYPVPLLHDIWAQMPGLKKKFVNYHDYKSKEIRDLFTTEQIENSITHEVTTLESIVLMSDGKGGFTKVVLPMEAQVSPVYSVLVEDFDGDGKQDILLGGNLFGAKPDVGRYDANYGTLLSHEQGEFKAFSTAETGLYLRGQVRDFEMLNIGDERLLLVSQNNDSLLFYTPTKYSVL